LTKLRRQQQREGLGIQRSQSSSSVRRPGSAHARFDKALPEGGLVRHQQSQGDGVSPEYSNAGRLPGRSRPSSASPKQQRPCSAGSARSVVDALRPRPPSAGRQARQPAPLLSSRDERRQPTAAAMKPPLIAPKRPSSASGRREAAVPPSLGSARAPNTDSGGPRLRLPLPTPPPQAPLCCGGGPLSLRA
jgi:hypothetical protein